MSLYRKRKNGKETGSYYIDITVPGGQRVRESTGTVIKKEAKEYHNKRERELYAEVKLGHKPKHTWKEATVRWIREKEAKGKKSLDKDLYNIKWLNTHFKDLYLEDITRDVIDKVTHIRLTEVSPATTNRTLAFIRGVLKAACEEWDWLDKVPNIRLFPEDNKREYWLTRKEAERLLSELPEHLKEIVEFALVTGLRSSNLTQLKWNQIDLERRIAIIPAHRTKSKKPITVPLIPEAVLVLRRAQGNNSEFVFTYRGKPFTRITNTAWYSACERAGLSARAHDLRHTFASWHVQAGTNLHDLQHLGGWSDVRMVQRYAHLSAERIEESAHNITGFRNETGKNVTSLSRHS